MTRVLLLDNHDSFTYNLVQELRVLGADCDVRLSDRTSLDEVIAFEAHGIILSPGPGTPDDAGITLEVIRALWTRAPASYQGQYYPVVDAYCEPRPNPLPPIMGGTRLST